MTIYVVLGFIVAVFFSDFPPFPTGSNHTIFAFFVPPFLSSPALALLFTSFPFPGDSAIGLSLFGFFFFFSFLSVYFFFC
jgi:hypothetical protein